MSAAQSIPAEIAVRSRKKFPDDAWGTDANSAPWRGYTSYTPAYVTKNEIESVKLPGIMHNGTFAELLALHVLVSLRSNTSTLIQRELLDLNSTFEEVLGFRKGAIQSCKLLTEVLEKVSGDCSIAAMIHKARFLRLRPWQVDESLTTWFDANWREFPEHPSYPSGHATEAFAIAEILAWLLPTRGRLLTYKAAFAIAERREIAGVHFRSDTIAGSILGAWVADSAKLKLAEEAERKLRQELHTIF